MLSVVQLQIEVSKEWLASRCSMWCFTSRTSHK